MLTYELYIDDRAVDMPPDLSMTLNFQSNLFQDFDKIQSSYSQTIKLPRTPRNARIFKSLTPATQNTIGEALSARLYMDGMNIIGEAHVYLLNVSDTYEVCLVWGVIKRQDTDGLLQDLPIYVNVQLGGAATPLGLAQGSYIYNANYNSGDPYLRHPVANLATLLRFTAQRLLGVSTPTAVFEAACNIGLPLTTRNESRLLNQAEVDSHTLFRVSNTNTHLNMNWARNSNRDYTTDTVRGGVKYNKAKGVNRIFVDLPALVLGVIGYDAQQTPYLQLTVQGEGEEAQIYSLGYARVESGFRVFSVAQEIELNKAITAETMNLTFSIIGQVGDNQSAWYIEEEEPSRFIALHKELPEGYAYDLRSNLPEKMKQSDFLKGMFNLYGLGITQTADDFGMISYNTLLQGGYGVKDWTSKLVNEDKIQTSHKTSGIGRRTWLRYKSGPGSAYVDLQDESLPDEADIFTLPFTYGVSNEVAYYTQENDGTYKLAKNDDCTILALGTQAAATLGTPQVINMANVKNTSWQGYLQWLQDPVIVECELRLNVVDIKTLRYDQLVHFDQLGRDYAILEVQSSGKETSKVKLLQIGA